MLRSENINKLNELEIFKNKVAFEFKDGWTSLIYELGNDIAKLCELTNCKLPHIQQIKTKLGTLRFYYDTSNFEYPKVVEKSIRLLVFEAENKSSRICEECGKNGKLRVLDGYWFTSCEEHSNEASLTSEEWVELQQKKIKDNED